MQVDPPQTESSDAYRAAVSGVETEIEYYDPNGAAPEMVVSGPVTLDEEDPVDAPELSDMQRLITSAIVIALLIGIVFFVVKFGGVNSAAFQRQPDGKQRARDNNQDDGTLTHGASALQDIAAIADRREALVLLTITAMRAAASQFGFRIGRSWTLRDVIRRVPRDWHHHGALANLARAAEAAHFGGRDVAEDDFARHYAAAEKILGAQA